MKANDNDEGALAPGRISPAPDLAFATPGNAHAAGHSHNASRAAAAGNPQGRAGFSAASSEPPQLLVDPGSAGGEGPISAGRLPPGDDAAADPLANLPLTLEFILQRRYLSLGEIQQFRQGKVLELDPEGEKHIEIRANGHLLALGELVQLEDRLGVELME